MGGWGGGWCAGTGKAIDLHSPQVESFVGRQPRAIRGQYLPTSGTAVVPVHLARELAS